MTLLSKEDDSNIKDEFAYPLKYERLDHESMRSMFNNYRIRNDKYAALKINIQTEYGLNLTVGCAHLIQQSTDDSKGILGKFYVSKIYRKTGYEEKCLIEVIKFAF